MKKIIWYWNFVFFNVYNLFKKTINLPMHYILKTKYIGNNQSEKLIDEYSALKMMQILFLFLEMIVLSTISKIAKKNLLDTIINNSTLTIVTIIALPFFSFLFNYLVISKNKKYLGYFREFRQKANTRRSIAFLIPAAIILIFFVSFLNLIKY